MSKASPKWTRTVSEDSVLIDLKKLEKDPQYNTKSRYHSDVERYPNNLITFAQSHIEHLKKFPNINPDQYISNLKLMTKIRA